MASASTAQPTQDSFADLVNVRPARNGEMGYVLHSWALTAFKAMPERWRCSYAIWCALFPRHQQYLLSRASVLVATPKDDDDIICGFVVFENQSPWIVHWAQTKARFKRGGIVRKLIETAGIKPGDPVVNTFPIPFFIKQPANWQHVPHWLT